MIEARTTFTGQLDAIRGGVVEMATMVIDRVGEVTVALLDGDLAAAKRIIDADDELDLLSIEHEDLCHEALLLQQPVASDLRIVVGALKMNADAERSGDLATNIAKAIARLQGADLNHQIRSAIEAMGEQCVLLFGHTVDALVQGDAQLATSIADLDDTLDELHERYIEMVMSSVARGELVPQQGLQLAVLGRFYERIGDHAVNMGERIRHILTGRRDEHVGAERARARRDSEHVFTEVDGGHPLGIAVLSEPSTEREIDVIRRDFVANASHELKTPVGAIALLSETLYDEEDPATRKRLLMRMNAEALRVGKLIDDLIEMSKVESDDSTRLAEVDLGEIMTEAATAVAPLAASSEVEIHLLALPAEIVVDADRKQLVAAITNLVDNAVKYSEAGSEVVVGSERRGAEIAIMVTDHGLGIPQADLQRVFERFYRVDKGHSRATGGTGLGLSIVRHVAQNHKGRVLVRSREGEGSTFTLIIPARAELV